MGIFFASSALIISGSSEGNKTNRDCPFLWYLIMTGLMVSIKSQVIQDTKEQYWGQQFCQMEKDSLLRPIKMTRPVKVDHHQSWSRIFQSDQTEMVYSVWCTKQNFQNFGLNGKCPSCQICNTCKPYHPEAGNGLVLSMKGWRGIVERKDQKMENTSL